MKKKNCSKKGHVFATPVSDDLFGRGMDELVDQFEHVLQLAGFVERKAQSFKVANKTMIKRTTRISIPLNRSTDGRDVGGRWIV